ncbi:MAG: hypothetical protein V4543_12010 [Bacteroidota bacterium]
MPKIQFRFFLLLLLTAASCGPEKPKEQPPLTQHEYSPIDTIGEVIPLPPDTAKRDSVYKPLYDTLVYCRQLSESNPFINNPFGVPIAFEELRLSYKYAPIEKQPYKNELTGTIDTLLTIRPGDSEFTYFKGSANRFFMRGDVRTAAAVLLRKELRIGTSKRRFLRSIKCKTKPTCDSITLGDDYGDEVIVYFRKNRIYRVRIENGWE